LFIHNIFATAASEKKEDDLNSSDPAVSDARDIFEFLDENNSSNTVEAVPEAFPENPKLINCPVLFHNLFGTPVSEKNEPGSSGLVQLSVDAGSTGVDDRAPIMLHLDSLKYHNGLQKIFGLF
jgi:hypothetical protein